MLHLYSSLINYLLWIDKHNVQRLQIIQSLNFIILSGLNPKCALKCMWTMWPFAFTTTTLSSFWLFSVLFSLSQKLNWVEFDAMTMEKKKITVTNFCFVYHNIFFSKTSTELNCIIIRWVCRFESFNPIKTSILEQRTK